MYSPSLVAMMREVIHTLGDINFAAEVEVENIEARALNPKLKEKSRSRVRSEPLIERSASRMWTSWKRCGGNSTASPLRPEGSGAGPSDPSNISQIALPVRLGEIYREHTSKVEIGRAIVRGAQ